MPVDKYFWDYVLWVLILVLEGWLLGVVLRERHYRTLPVFCSYLVFRVLRSLTLLYLALAAPYRIYFWTYWVLGGLIDLALFPVIYEIFDFSRPSYRICLAAALGFAALTVMIDPTGAASKVPFPLMAAIHGVSKVGWIVVTALFFWATALEGARRREAFGASAGLVVLALANLAKTLLIVHLPYSYVDTFKRVPNLVYPLVVLVWLGYLLPPKEGLGITSAEIAEMNTMLAEVEAGVERELVRA